MNTATNTTYPNAEATIIQPISLGKLFWIFLKIGCISFGGFMALISVIADTVVEKHRLLTNDDMLDGISLANLLPGPQGVNCVAYIGYRLRGTLGAALGAIAVLLPTVALIVSLTVLYLTYATHIPALGNLFAGFVPAIAAIIFTVAHRMATNVLKGWREAVLALAAALALLLAPQTLKLYVTLSIVADFGLLGYGLFRQAGARTARRPSPLPWRRLSLPLIALGLLLGLFLAQPRLDPHGLPQIALTFSGLSLMLFGGGYVFIPMIQEVVVSHYEWVSTQQFLDGIAFSQVTPGPILVIATFIAQKVTTAHSGLALGVVGALVGTAAIFTPPAVLMVTASVVLEEIKQSPVIQASMRGIRYVLFGLWLGLTAAGCAMFEVKTTTQGQGQAVRWEATDFRNYILATDQQEFYEYTLILEELRGTTVTFTTMQAHFQNNAQSRRFDWKKIGKWILPARGRIQIPLATYRDCRLDSCREWGSLAPIWHLELMGTDAQGKSVREVIEMSLPLVVKKS